MQNESNDCGIAVIQTMLQHLRIETNSLAENLSNVLLSKDIDYDAQGLTLLDMQVILEKYGVHADAYEVEDFNELKKQKTPYIIMVSNEGMPHFILVHNMNQNEMVISNPAKSKIEIQDVDSIKNIFLGYAICIEKIIRKPQKVKENSYPEKIIKTTLKEISFSEKFFAVILVIIGSSIPIFSVYLLEYILGMHIDKVDGIFIICLIIFMGCLLFLHFGITKYNTFFKIKLNNKTRDKILSLYFENKLKDISARKNINNISAYFWNIIIAIQGLLEKFYLKVNMLFTGILILLLSKYSILLSAILFVCTVAFCFVVRTRINTLRTNYKNYIKTSNTFASGFEESISTTLDINVFSMKNYAKQGFKTRMEDFLKSIIDIGNVEAELKSLREIFTILTLIIYFMTYYYLYFIGTLDLLAGISSGVYVLYIATGGLSSVFDGYLEYVKSRDAIEYIESRNDFKTTADAEIKNVNIDKVKSIKIQNLSFAYDHAKIITNKDFLFIEGKVYGIVGSNGAGKSTLIKLLCGLIPSQDGLYSINEDAVFSDLNMTDINRYISLYTTEMDLYNQTVQNNGMFNVFSNDLDNSNFHKWDNDFKKELGLELPDSYVVTSGGTNLSQGQKQKLLLLRTLNRKADVYVFDEPTGNLDKTSKIQFINIVKRMAKEKNKIIIIVSHSEKIIQNCDIVYDLDRGEYK